MTPITLETERLILRPYTAADFEIADNAMRREATKIKAFWAQVDKEWIDEAEYAILAEDYFR
ncbi:MAG: hypothetical protein LBN00_00060 [Oscillospiraceae bacterium]|jgi:RimJ/RimL family protein N-acetyltransferase|nr:hypothetical protein [Oscillospiraceae bacterium]